jgi:hypothetical protein
MLIYILYTSRMNENWQPYAKTRAVLMGKDLF